MNRTKLLLSAEMNCTSFVNNLALSGATREQMGRGRVLNNFWGQISRNAKDLAILDWCHAFGQKRDALYWSKVFPDDDKFRDRLLSTIGVSLEAWEQFWNQMKKYRDKDLAHLELVNISTIPAMGIAIHSMAFYFAEVQAAKKSLGMHCRDKTLYDYLEMAGSSFDRQAALALAATGTPRESFVK